MTGGTGGSAPGQPWGAAALRLSYDGALALDDVTVAVTAGQVTAVVGGDGAGKTSLLRCLAGVLRPDAGEVRSPAKSRIGFLPAGSGLYPDLTVSENLAFRATAYGLRGAAAVRRAAELTEQAGLAAARDRLAAHLSGGMRQKLGVIAALLHRPELLILDEPSTGVDPVSRSGLWWLIASAAADGAAVILATTYIDDAQRAADVLVLDAGRPLASGAPEQIIRRMPGSVRAVATRPAAELAWRRGPGWRVWCPPGSTEAAGPAAEPDLQDAVIVAALARQSPDQSERERAILRRAAPERATTGQQHRGQQRLAGPLAESVAVTCRFGTVTAVSDVSIAVRPGEIVGLLGANGGKIYLSGRDITHTPMYRRARLGIGYLTQEPSIFRRLTVEENVLAVLELAGWPRQERRRQLDLLLDELGIAKVRRLRGNSVSGGERRRAEIARCLAAEPAFILLDEPFAGIDPIAVADIQNIIAHLKQKGLGILITDHNVRDTLAITDRAYILHEGRVLVSGDSEAVANDPVARKFYLGERFSL